MSKLYEKTDYYTNYLKDKNVDLNDHLDISGLVTSVSLDPEPFYKFAEDYRSESLQKHFKPRPFFDYDSMQQTVFLNSIGYNEHNTFEYNYGIKEKHNKILKEMLGRTAIEHLNIDYDTAGLRLLEYKPGNGLPLHTDSYNAFRDKNNLPADHGSVHRYFVAVSPWSWGHVLQVHDNVISNWKPGYVCEIPSGVFHLSVNFGIEPKFSLTVTGFRK